MFNYKLVPSVNPKLNIFVWRFFFKIPPALGKPESKLPSGFAQMAMMVKECVHQSAKLKMAETELTEILKRGDFSFLFICLRCIYKVASFRRG